MERFEVNVAFKIHGKCPQIVWHRHLPVLKHPSK